MKQLLLSIILLLLIAPLSIQAQSMEDECEDGYRLFDHEYLAGEPICIPEDPQRIVALDEGIMAGLIALDVPPIAVQDYSNRDFTTYLDTSEIISVGTPEGPNYEAMLELEPDLIIGKAIQMNWFGESGEENLRSIAPMILSEEYAPDWQENFLLIGAAINRLEEAQAQLESYEERLSEFSEAMGDDLETISIAIIRSRPDNFNIYAAESYFIVDLVTQAGLQFPDAFENYVENNNISLEELDVLNSDYLFVMVRNENEASGFEAAADSPLWQLIPAVKNEQVYQVNWGTWVAGWNIIGANLVIDDLYDYLTDNLEPETQNPFADLIVNDFNPLTEETEETVSD